jgi:predicted exporter/outer membrane lipoprotein-sorting protein
VRRGSTAGWGFLAAVAGESWRHARLILLLAGAFVLSAPLLLHGLRVDSDSSRLLPREEPLGRAFRAQRARFGETAPLLLQLLRRGGDPEAFDAFTERLGKALASWKDVRFVDFELIGPSRRNEEALRLRAAFSRAKPEDLNALASRFTRTGMERQLRRTRRRVVTVDDPGLRDWILEDPLGIAESLLTGSTTGMASLARSLGTRYLDTPDGRSRIIWLQPAGSAEDGTYCVRLLQRVDALVAEARALVPGAGAFEVRTSGVHAITAESVSVLLRQMVWISSAATVALFALLWLVFRDLRATLLCFAPLIVAQIAILVLARSLFNPVYAWSIGYVAIAMGLGLDAAIHLSARFYRFLGDRSPLEAVTAACQDCGVPIALGVASTAAAFMAILLGHSPGLAQFAVLTALGLLITVVVTFLLFPALVRVLGVGRYGSWTGPRPTPGFFRAVAARPGLWSVAALGILVAALPLAAHSRLDVGALNLIPRGLRSVEAGKAIAKAFGGSFILTSRVVVSAPDLESALQLQRLVDDELAALHAEGRLAGYQSPSELVAEPAPPPATRAALAQLKTAIGGGRDTFFDLLAGLRFRDPAALAGAYDTLERATGALRQDDGAGGSRARVALRLARGAKGVHLQTTLWPSESPDSLDELDGSGLRTITNRLRGLPRPPNTDLEVMGILQVYDRVNALVVPDLKRIGWAGALLVAGVVLLYFRNLRESLLCLLPLAAALPTTLALAWLLGVSFTQTAVCFVAVVLGIGIDDAVHVFVRLRRGAADSASVIREIGPALTLTTVSTAIGFGCLAFSSLPVLASMGASVALGVLACWFFSIFLLPGVHRLLTRLGRATILGLLVIVTTVGTCTAADDAQPTRTQKIMAKLQERWQDTEAVSCKFRQTKSLQAIDGPIVLEGSLLYMKPRFLRLEVSGDENLVITSDGETLWVEDRDLGEVEEMSLATRGDADPTSLLPLLLSSPAEWSKRFDIVVEKSAGGPERLVFTSRPDGPPTPIARIETELGTMLRIRRTVVTYRNGDSVETEFRAWTRTENLSKYLFRPPGR